MQCPDNRLANDNKTATLVSYALSMIGPKLIGGGRGQNGPEKPMHVTSSQYV